MQKALLSEMIEQNQLTSHYSFDRVTEETARLRLNDRTASVGFILRHFGTVSRARLFAHALYHTSHHAGQISLTLSKGTEGGLRHAY